MRKSVSPLPGDEGGSSASTTRVFGVPLEEVTRTHTISGHEVPALVKHIVDYIEEHGHLDLEGLFLVNGNAERVDWLRQRYDSGEEVELEKEADLASAVSLLRLFLQELPEPVIPTAIQGHILQLHQDYSNEEELCRNLKYLLQQLPQLNYGLLRFLCRFLASVASLQQESWNIGALAAVFGPDIFHLSTDGEDLRDQESVSRVLAELLDNQEGLFDSEDDDVSTTNDYSSINEQVKISHVHVSLRGSRGVRDVLTMSSFAFLPLYSSHLSPISILPADSAEIIQRTIRAAVEQHFLELKTSLDQDLSNYESQGAKTVHCAPAVGNTNNTDSFAVQPAFFLLFFLFSCSRGGCVLLMNPEPFSRTSAHLITSSSSSSSCAFLCFSVLQESGSCRCDQNANTSETNRNHPSPCQPTAGTAPHLQLFPDNQWEDPVPAYKSWQDDNDSGEAQLSPLAGRMVPLPPLPLEGDAHSAQRFLQQDPDTTSPTKAQRPRRASFGSKEALRGGDSMTHQLTKKLQHLKKKIKQFEEQFEKERNYKPSHGDKAANPKVLKWMTDLTKIRRQIKDAKHRAETELGPQTRPRSNTLPKSFGSTLDQGVSDAAEEVKGQHPTREETLDLIQRRVKGKRQEDGWPDDIKKMTKEQLSCEKTVLQKNLLHYEGLHGRPVTREERLVMKPLYDRYRLVKQMLTRVSITPITVSPSSKRRSQTLQPIIEGETAHFWEEIKEEEEDEQKGGSGGGVQTPLTACSCVPSFLRPELLEQLWKARAEKKKLRKTIREFEEDFYQHNGRNVQKEDRMPMLEEYREYKRIKAKLRLLEVLISKQDSSKSI
uniref:Family with sequence similarity 13 member B n=1 Tax=Sphaeramia orbicularis TaxID=375764 RepID=A0A672ZC99_9TELE